MRILVIDDDVFVPEILRGLAARAGYPEVTTALNITKQIVEQTGGTIGLESSEGGKTTFWFTVPVNEPN
jgi:signal transduction histidine kinase